MEKQLIKSNVLFETIESFLREGKQASFIVTGMSMWPFLCHGRDSVVIEACSGEDVKVGDIVLLRTPAYTYILHRVIKIRDNQIETLGDGRCISDGFFSKECVIGRVISFDRKGKIIDCREAKWKCIFTIWRMLRPARKPLLLILQSRWLHKIKNRVK